MWYPYPLSFKIAGITISRNSLNGNRKKRIGWFLSIKFRTQIEHQVNDYTSRVFIMPCLLYYVSLYGVCFSSSGPQIRPCRLSVIFLYSIFELQHQRIKISVNKIESILHCIVLLRLFENKMATTAVGKLFIQSLCECLTTYVDAHQKLGHTLTLIFFDCKCMIEFNLCLFWNLKSPRLGS